MKTLQKILVSALVGTSLLAGCSQKDIPRDITSSCKQVIGANEFCEFLGDRPYEKRLNGDSIGNYWYEVTYTDDFTGQVCTSYFERE